MPRPTSSTTIQRPDLGQIAYEYAMDAEAQGFIAEAIFPTFDTPEEAADYPVIPIEATHKMPPASARAPRAAYPRDDWEFETATYSCQDYGNEYPVDDVEAKKYRRFFDAESMATKMATAMLLRRREKQTADAVFSTSNISATSSAATAWSTVASATPIDDIDATKLTMYSTYGIEANCVVLNKTNLSYLRRNAQIRDALKYTNPVEIRADEAFRALLAQLFGVDKVLVAKGQYDSAKKGKAFSLSGIWSTTYALVAKVATDPMNLKEPCLGRTFLWTADSPSMLTAEQYREEQTRSWIYRVRHNIDPCFVFANAGHLLNVA